jgi:hypothetical protein
VPQPVIGAPFVRPGGLVVDLGMPKKPLLPPGPHSRRRRYMFRERDLARAMRAVQRAGGGFRIEIDRVTGNLQLIVDVAVKDKGAANSWDEVLSRAEDAKRPS